MRLLELTEGLPLLEQRNWNPSLEVSGIVSDSRRVKGGDLFVACSGSKADGHQFFKEAIRQGAHVCVGERLSELELPEGVVFLGVPDSREALAILLNQLYGFPSKKLRLVGVTGTNGKTTIAYLLKSLLEAQVPSGYIGTLGYSTPDREGPLSNTTPGAEELFPLLGQLVQEGIGMVILEVSSHALHQKRVRALEFELALFTGLTPEHLDYHRTLEDYFKAKRLLFSHSPRPKKVLINQDSPYGRRLLEEFPEAKSFGLHPKTSSPWGRRPGGADYFAREINATFEGAEFLFEGPRGKVRFRTQLPLLHNVANAVAVLASLDLLGCDPKNFRDSLEGFSGVPGRLERFEGEGFTVFVDYAHTPEAFENVLSEARRLRPKRILTLFGCGGDRDPSKRPPMTRIAYHYSDFVILTSDNPRTEDPLEILREMRRGLPTDARLPNVLEILDRRVAICELLQMAKPGDILFVLGKGHEDCQILGPQRIPFDDREVVREWLQRRCRVGV